jgi:SAM-dependent methyltransferase
MLQFDQHADAYDAIRARIAYPESLYERLVALCPSREAALDLGCGTGSSTARLAPYFEYVEGIDLGEQLVAKARARHPGLAFRVSAAEELFLARRFDLVTIATAFYWMDRDAVLLRAADWLAPGGVLAAYRYDFPIVYGVLRDVVERELVTRWARYRDPRLVAYDDTWERIRASGVFAESNRIVEPNVLTLTPRELGLFFLSTSYVTRFLEVEAPPGYANEWLGRLDEAAHGQSVQVGFDVTGWWARRR